MSDARTPTLITNSAYPSMYLPGPVAVMLGNILELDAGRAAAFAEHLPALPHKTEAWFPIPSIAALARRHFPDTTDPNEQYCAAVRLILEKIEASRAFRNKWGSIVPNVLRLDPRTASAYRHIFDAQEGEIALIPAQTGIHRRLQSLTVQNVCDLFGSSGHSPEGLESGDEFGLDVLMVGAILLTSPDRMLSYSNLSISCPGNRANRRGGHVLRFEHDLNHIELNAHRRDTTFQAYTGAASGILP